MIRNKIMILAIGILTLGDAAGAQSLRADNGPAERPPASYRGKQYVDSKGCVYIRAGSGARVTWIPRVNRKRQVFCSNQNKPSLSASQLAKITGQPATKVVKPAAQVAAAKPAKAQQTASATASQPVDTIPKPPKKRFFGSALFKAAPAKPEKAAPKAPVQVATVIPPKPAVPKPTKQPRRVAQVDTGYNAVKITGEKPAYTKTSVRGFSVYDRRNNRNALRGPQDVHPAELIKAQRAAATYQQPSNRLKKTVVRAVDPIHKLFLYPVVLNGDITARGNAQMAMVWSNTVPMKLVQRGRLQLAESSIYSRSQ